MNANLIYIKDKIAIIILVILTFFLTNCGDNTINNPAEEVINNGGTLNNDIYEPNNMRSQAYNLISIPFQKLEGVLINKNDIDWFKFSVADEDTCEIRFEFKMENMTEYFAIEGCFYNETEFPKGCFKLYKGPDSDAASSFGWKCTSGDYYFFVKIDTSCEKDAGKYYLDITK